MSENFEVGKGTTRMRDRFLNIFGTVVNKQNILDLKKHTETSQTLFSETELALLRSDKQQSTGSNHIGSSVIGHIESTTADIARRIDEATELAQIFPEADQARSILIPSIMSPTDMNGSSVQVSYSGSILPEASVIKLCENVSSFINEDMELPTKLPLWIGDAMFKTGATPVLQLPSSLASDISTKTEGGVEAAQVKINMDITPSFITNKSNDTIDLGTESIDAIKQSIPEGINVNDTDISNMAQRLSGSLDGILDVSLDVGAIVSATESNNAALEKLSKKAAGSLASVGDNSILLVHSDNVAVGREEGVAIRLPAGSVVPLSPPGAPESRLGYFVAIDGLGSPIDSSGAHANINSLSASEEFGKLFNGNPNAASSRIKNVNSEKKSGVMNDMFDLILDHTLMSSIKEHTGTKYSIANNKNLSMAIFCKVLAKEKVSFIFVPANQLAYYAFDYHEDGSGKSFVEGASLIIALRSACLISKVYSIINSAKDRRKVTYELPEGADNSQAEQINSVVRKLVTEKYGMNLTTNYRTFLDDISTSGISIVPRNLEGLKDFSVEQEVVNDNLSQVDTELEELLTRMAAMRLKVPAGALDNVHEQEFSRSIATSNILFSNDVRVLQQVVCRETDILIRAAILNSSKMVEGITKLISDSGITSDKDVQNIPVEAILGSIVKDLNVSLPSPKVSTDAAKLSEVNETSRAISDAVDSLWPESFIMSEDDKVKDAFVAYKDSIKQEQIEQLLASSGDSNFNNIPNIKEIDLEKLRRVNQIAHNVASMADRLSSAVTPEDGDDSGGRNW